ncbi:MAG: hypothetical protein ACI4V3_05260 [Faecousia sp.]
MSRLTTDTPNGNTENALNLFYIKDMDDIDIVRIIEILSANAEGRLLVLPCKVGESVFTVQRSCISEYRITGFSIDGKSVFAKWELIDGFYGAFRIDGVPASRIGYDVFKSREEAEAALRRLDDGD